MKLYAIFVAPDHPANGEPEPDDGAIRFYWADNKDHAITQALDTGLNVYTQSVRVTPYTVRRPY